MFVLVQHTISDPAKFWNSADPRAHLPPTVKLPPSFPTPDGTRAACIWEAESTNAVRDYIEPLFGQVSRNEYFTVENKEGFARPSKVPETAAAVR